MGSRPILGLFGAAHKPHHIPRFSQVPELPEVEVTRRGLAPHLAGRVISAVEVREPRLRWPVPAAVRSLAGRTVRAVHRRGKYLLVDCGDGHLILHLGMSGSLRVLPPGTPAQKHYHFDLVLGDRASSLRDYVGTDGVRGHAQSRHWVYEREGKPCRRCDAKVKRLLQGARSTYYCPGCQRKK